MNTIIHFFLLYFLLATTRYFLFAGIPFFALFVLLKQKVRSYFILKKHPMKLQIKSEILHSLLTIIIISLLSTIFPFKISYHHCVKTIFFHFLLIVIVHDAYFYWTHRLMHHEFIFRFIHKTHHKSININPFTAYSFGLGEALINGIYLPLYLVIIPAPIQSVVIFGFFTFMANVQVHLGHEFFPSWWAKLNLTCTSTHHYLHHRDFHYNYGFYFPWWDKLMGTEHPKYQKTFHSFSKKEKNLTD